MQLYDFELDSTIRPFENFSMGTELFTSLDKEHDIVDRDWRPFVEECDLMQGMQVFTTLDDAWGGFASSYLEALRDEYPKSCIWVWGLQSPLVDVPREKRQLRLSNTAQTLQQAYMQASMVVPLALPETQLPPNIALDRNSPWHVSSLLAAVSETALVPSRLKDYNGAPTLGDLAEGLNTTGNQTLARAAVAIPADVNGYTKGEDMLNFFQIGRGGAKMKHRRNRTFGELTCYRGPSSDEKEPDEAPVTARRQIIGNPIIRRYFSLRPCTIIFARPELTRCYSYATTLQFPLLDSYPHIYQDMLEKKSIPTRSTICTDTSISKRIKTLRAQGTRLIGLEERETLSNGLAEIADAYQDDWSSGSDEDDDEM